MPKHVESDGIFCIYCIGFFSLLGFGAFGLYEGGRVFDGSNTFLQYAVSFYLKSDVLIAVTCEFFLAAVLGLYE